MKGGKAGQGRKKPSARPGTPTPERSGPKRGESKRDWGPIERDEPVPPARATNPKTP